MALTPKGKVEFSYDTDPGRAVQTLEQNKFNSAGFPEIHIADQHSEIIDLHISMFISLFVITINTNVDDVQITGDVDPAFIPIAGQLVCLKENTAFYQAQILTAVNNAGDNWTLTLDTPLDYAFTTVGGCSIRTQNLNIDGSITPQVFSLSPANLVAGTRWDVTRLIVVIESATAMDSGKFGGIDALLNGVVLRSVNGITKNIFNIKTNGDFAAHSYDVTYDSRAPAGVYGIRVRSSFAGQDKRGVSIRLAADDNDSIQFLIRDDLTGLTKFHVVIQGHVVFD